MLLQQSIFMILQQQQWENLNEQVPKQLHFGQQTVTLLTSHRISSGFQSTISAIPFTSSSEGGKKLSQKLMRECYSLAAELKRKEYSREECLLYSLRRMSNYVVEDADKNGMLLSHKIFYLSLQYLAHIISKSKSAKGIPKQERVSYHAWLADVHSLFFGSSFLQENDNNSIFGYLRSRNYHQLLECIQSLQKSEKDEYKTKLLQLIAKIILLRIDEVEKQANQNSQLTQIAKTSPFLLEQYRNKYISLGKAYTKQIAIKPQGKDVLDLAFEVLLGTDQCIRHLVKSSWPLYLILLSPQGSSCKEMVRELLPRDSSSEESIAYEYLLNLMGSASLHLIYQSSFNLLPPLQCHLLAYLLHFYHQSSPLTTLIQEDYINDIARCLLQQASNNGSFCLFYAAAYLESNQIIERKAEMLQPLLYQHLSVVDPEDPEQIRQFLRRVKMMAKLGLQRYAQSHFDTLFFSLISGKRLDAQLIQCFTMIASLYGRTFPYDEEMAAYLERYLFAHAPEQKVFAEIELLGRKLRSKKVYKKQTAEYAKLQPYFERMRTINLARTGENLWEKIAVATQLIQSSGQSIPLLTILVSLSLELAASHEACEYNEDEIWRQQLFCSETCRYIDHYPQSRSSRESELINSLYSIYQ